MDIEFEKNGTTLLVKPNGRLDSATSQNANAQIREKAEGVTEMILDLENVAYVSSGGLRVILEWHQEMEDRGGSMKVLHVNEYIKEVFDLTGFLEFLVIE